MVLSLAMSLASFGLISKWYVMPQLNAVSRATALTLLLLPHTFRHIGVSFLVPGVVSPSLASRTLADTTVYGVITAAARALYGRVAGHSPGHALCHARGASCV